jgi:hypothetical protein
MGDQRAIGTNRAATLISRGRSAEQEIFSRSGRKPRHKKPVTGPNRRRRDDSYRYPLVGFECVPEKALEDRRFRIGKHVNQKSSVRATFGCSNWLIGG